MIVRSAALQRTGSLTVPIAEKTGAVFIHMDGQPLIELTTFQAQQLGTMLLEASAACRAAASALGEPPPR